MIGPPVLHVDRTNPRCGLGPHALHKCGISDRQRLNLRELLKKLSNPYGCGHAHMIVATAGLHQWFSMAPATAPVSFGPHPTSWTDARIHYSSGMRRGGQPTTGRLFVVGAGRALAR